MLDPRIYRAGWIPVLFVVVLVAFSLREAPRPAQTTLSAQAFDGGAALALARGFARNPVPAPIARRLLDLARTNPADWRGMIAAV